MRIHRDLDYLAKNQNLSFSFCFHLCIFFPLTFIHTGNLILKWSLIPLISSPILLCDIIRVIFAACSYCAFCFHDAAVWRVWMTAKNTFYSVFMLFRRGVCKMFLQTDIKSASPPSVARPSTSCLDGCRITNSGFMGCWSGITSSGFPPFMTVASSRTDLASVKRLLLPAANERWRRRAGRPSSLPLRGAFLWTFNNLATTMWSEVTDLPAHHL